MGDRVSSTLVGFRIRVTLEAVKVEDTDLYYCLVADSSGSCLLRADNLKTARAEPSGLIGWQTHESMEGTKVTLEFGKGPISELLEGLVQPNDFVSVEIAGPMDAKYRLAFLGLVSDINTHAQGTPNGFSSGMTLSAEGLKKFFDQSIYNWQGVMALGDSILTGNIGKEAFDAYEELIKNAGVTSRPDQVIKALIKIGVSNSVQALVHEKRVEPGDLFAFGPDWGSLYPAENAPITASWLMSTWTGSLWALVESLAERDIHEIFWTIRTIDGEDKPVLIHRPRPFPDGGVKGGNAQWLKLEKHVFGKDGRPGALGFMRQRSDGGRVNAFHWGQSGGFTDSDGASQAKKMVLGWYCDARSIKKYGFAPREVAVGLLPSNESPNWLDLVGEVLHRVACQEAGLYLMGNESRSYGCLLPGVHVGQVAEEWTNSSSPTTGYITSVSQVYKSSPQGIVATATLGIARSIRGVTFEEYPDACASLSTIQHVQYISNTHASEIGAHGAKTGEPTLTATGVPNANLIATSSASHSVPAWFMAKLYGKESSFGTDHRMNSENEAGALGPMQITHVAITDANQLGYACTLEDRRDTAKAMDIAAFLVKHRYAPAITAAGCDPSSDYYWSYVADAYYLGGAAAAASGQAANWGLSGLSEYGSTLDQAGAQTAFGGIK